MVKAADPKLQYLNVLDVLGTAHNSVEDFWKSLERELL